MVSFNQYFKVLFHQWLLATSNIKVELRVFYLGNYIKAGLKYLLGDNTSQIYVKDLRHRVRERNHKTMLPKITSKYRFTKPKDFA